MIKGKYSYIVNFFSSIEETTRCRLQQLQYRIKNGNCSFPYEEKYKGRRLYVLSNGPSFLEEYKELQNDSYFHKSDKICVNSFIYSDLIKEIKPCYYCFADPSLYGESEKSVKLYNALNEIIDWDMTLFVLSYDKKKTAIVRQHITNHHIRIVPISKVLYGGFESRRYNSWKRGKTVPLFVNVSIMQIFIGLNMGYSELFLYGVDHTFFDGLTVGDDNLLYMTENHFYGSKQRIINNSQGGVFTMKGWIRDKYLTFLEHERMEGYAEYLGAKIINCTKKSLIDAYPRIAQFVQQKKSTI
jgi:hypothetical protein